MSTQTFPTGPIFRSTTTEKTGIHYSTIYLYTVPGRLKLICLVSTLIAFLCIRCSDFRERGSAELFSAESMLAFLFTGILLVSYLFNAINVYSEIPWIKIEFYFCINAAAFLGISSAIAILRLFSLLGAAGIFGFVAMCAYAYDAYLKYQLCKTSLTFFVTRNTTVTEA